MKINLEFDTEATLKCIESTKLESINNHLLMGYNGYMNILMLLNEVPLLKEMYDNEMIDMQQNGNCGTSTCFRSVIIDAFYSLQYYKKQEECETDSEYKKLRDENYKLKRDVEKLEKRLNSIKDAIK